MDGQQEEAQRLQRRRRQADQRQRTVGSIFSDCLRRSSVRGIPRIFSSRGTALKVMWVLSVLLLFALFLVNIISMVQIYRRGDTMFSKMKWEPLPPFPSFSICNFSPISSAVLPFAALTPADYRHRIIHMVHTTFKEDEHKMNILYRLLEPRVYHDHLNMSQVLNYTKQDELILRDSCQIHFVNNSSTQVKRCSGDPDFASIEFRYVPGYSHCQTLRIKRGDNVKKVVLHVLLKSRTDRLGCWYCMLENPATLRKGIILYLHPDSAYPVNIERGLFLLPGTQNIIHVKQKQVLHVKDCVEEQKEPMNFFLAGRRVSSSYYPELCRLTQRTDMYRRFCRCTTQTLPQRVSSRSQLARLDLCFRQDLNASSVNTSLLHCLLDVDSRGFDGRHVNEAVERYVKEQGDLCPSTCSFVRHTVAHSSSLGVTKSSALEIYSEYIRNSRVYNQTPEAFRVYESARLLWLKGDTAAAASLLNSTDFLEQNFLTLVLSFSKHHAEKQQENWVMEASSLIGQIGGALALFSGVTLICVAELIELLIHLAAHARRSLLHRPHTARKAAAH